MRTHGDRRRQRYLVTALIRLPVAQERSRQLSPPVPTYHPPLFEVSIAFFVAHFFFSYPQSFKA